MSAIYFGATYKNEPIKPPSSVVTQLATSSAVQHTKNYAGNYIIKDNAVYYKGAKSPADLATFEIIPEDGDFHKDKSHVYYSVDEDCGPPNHRCYKIITLSDADPNTFEDKGGYALDSKHVFVSGFGDCGNHGYDCFVGILENVDPKTFEYVGENVTTFKKYYKDKNHVYDSFFNVLQGVSPIDCSKENILGCVAAK